MLVIPVPTRDLDGLHALVTEQFVDDGVATVTPQLAEQLLERWVGAQIDEASGERWLYLPFIPRGRAVEVTQAGDVA